MLPAELCRFACQFGCVPLRAFLIFSDLLRFAAVGQSNIHPVAFRLVSWCQNKIGTRTASHGTSEFTIHKNHHNRVTILWAPQPKGPNSDFGPGAGNE